MKTIFVRDVERGSQIHVPSLKQFGEGTDFELDIDIIKKCTNGNEKNPLKDIFKNSEKKRPCCHL